MDNLADYSLGQDPLDSFFNWYQIAQKVEENPEAMTLATIDEISHRPCARTVLFKGLTNEKELIFYTNYSSAKSQELVKNPEACLLFYWHASKKQVRLHGRVHKMKATDSEKYFHGRDRASQLASLVSMQSSPIEDKGALLKKLDEAHLKYDGREIPLPDHWGGMLFVPYEFEFFLYGDHRLNDRFLYTKKTGQWVITRLQP